MINLTVKTLDSRNHEFSVEDDITVAQFKEKISDQIDIPADTQRIIYCGRVLKDELKLNDYDVNGKVVHLVQRAPPSTTQGPARAPSPSPPRQRTGTYTLRNTLDNIYLGSMQIPATFMEAAASPPPTHSLAASRLNVAKRMLRRTETVLNQLENPAARGDQTPPEEPQEEITPVFEARVIVPNALNDPIDEAFVLSAVQDTIFNNPPTTSATNLTEGASASVPTAETSGASQASVDEAEAAAVNSESSSPEGTTPASTPTPGSAPNSESRSQGASGNVQDNVSPTTEMADLLDQLGRIQIRLAPFLEQYQNFMRQDPQVAQEDSRKTQVMLNRVSEILHFLGHAYHSLSDIIVRARTPPPRPLLCRPILIQHSAVVQTGIPIQVEAAINFNAEPPLVTSNPPSSQTQSSTTAAPAEGQANSENQQSGAEGQQPSATTVSGDGNRPSGNGAQHRPQVFRFPLGPGIHVESVPLPLPLGGLTSRINVPDVDPSSNMGEPAGTDTSANNSEDAAARNSGRANTGSAENNSSTANNTSQQQPQMNRQSVNIPDMFQNNPNVEFIMEVTPETITIDSLEATLLGTNRVGDLLRGNAPSPDFIQSIMQVAGQIMTRGAPNVTISTGATPPTQQPSAPPAENSTANQTPQANVSSSQPTGQNSQARGNTSTNPTTSTHTRTSSRPHVHLAQHAMQGFDPFLPCNSHHVTNRRRATSIRTGGQFNANQNSSSRTTAPNNGGGAQGMNNQFNPLYNLVQGILNSFQTAVRQRANPATSASASNSTSTASSRPTAGGTSGDGNGIPPPPYTFPLSAIFPTLQNMNLSDVNPQGPTIAQLLQYLPDENYVEGESIFNDLVMFLARNLTLHDVMQLNNSRLEPLMRIRRDLRNFFLFQILNGVPNANNTDRGVNRLLSEMQPFLENLGRLNVRDDIDIVRSAQMLFRARLPNIISLAASHSPNSLRILVEQCRITARQLTALALYASVNGQSGVEEVIEHIVTRYMQGIPQDLQQWTLVASRAHFRQYMANLSVPDSILQPYIVRRVDSVTTPVVETERSAPPPTNNEPMDVDEQEPSGSTVETPTPLPELNIADDPEPLPKVVLGSEGWHGQVPADWVPLIARDSQRQRRQNQQPAFSDAYLSGMPSKRRKIVTNTKPQGSLPQVISESVRRAVTATGLANVTNLEVVSQAAGADINIQSAYRDLLRSSVQSNLQDNEDFTPDRFPNATNYFNKPQ